jgi:hypothetical protein
MRQPSQCGMYQRPNDKPAPTNLEHSKEAYDAKPNRKFVTMDATRGPHPVLTGQIAELTRGKFTNLGRCGGSAPGARRGRRPLRRGATRLPKSLSACSTLRHALQFSCLQGMVRWHADEPHITLRTHCSPYHTNSPFYPVIKQLELAARFEREDGPDVKLKKLEAVLAHGCLRRLRLRDAFGRWS